MPLELAKENMVWKEQAGKQTTQILLEGDMIVPDSKPDAKEILRCEGRVRLGDKKISEDRVGFSGELEVCVLYAAKNGERPLYGMTASLPIADFLHMDGLEKDMEVSLEGRLEHLDCQIINDRKLGIKAVIAVEGEAEKERSGEILCNAEGEGVECLRGTLRMEREVAEKRDRFTVKEELSLPAAKPEIGEILWSGVTLTDLDIRPMEGKVMVRGNLKVSLLYTDAQNGGVSSFTEKIPFSGYLEEEELDSKTEVDTSLWVEDMKLTPMMDEDGEAKQLAVDVAIGARLKGREPMEKEILLDAYVPRGKAEIKRESMTLPRTVAKGENQFTIKERIALERGEAPMLRAEQAWAEARLQELRAAEDAIEAEGVLTVEILYHCEDDESPLCMVKRGIPFSQTVVQKGVRSSDAVEGQIRLEDTDFQILSDEEGELRAVLTLEAKTRRWEKGDMVTDLFLEEGEEDEGQRAGAVIYVVQPGDSLWSIAKAYRTTMEDILAVNEIENPEVIYPGQKLLLIKMMR